MPISKASSVAWTEQKAVADDSSPNAWFGLAVAISGNTALIAARNATVEGRAGQGAVYVFQNIGGIWTQTQKLVAHDGAAFDQFGTAITLKGGVAVITAPLAMINGHQWQGAAYVFALSGGSWVQTQKLVAGHGAAFETFGVSAALNSNSLFIGAGGTNFNGQRLRRLVYVFRLDPGARGWAERQTLNAPDPTDPGSAFGSSVCATETVAMVGACNSTIGGLPNKGEVYVYSQTNGSWLLSATLVANDGGARANFGVSIAIEGSTALIGASGATVEGKVGEGAVYRFTLSKGTWSQTEKILAKDGDALNLFGASVGLSHTLAIVGAYVRNSYKGAAYLMNQVSGQFLTQQKLEDTQGIPGDVFGYACAIDGSTALVGAYTKDVNGLPDAGVVFFYTGPSIGPHP
jgi:hypothetical protein